MGEMASNFGLNPMAGRPGLPGNAKESSASATLAANPWAVDFGV